MIAFASLFLGLVVGVQTIDLVVAEPVAAVEIRLDGVAVGRIEAPPWTLPCDLGPELVPRELLAIAVDKEGNELGRVQQLLNVPRPPVEASLVLEQDAGRQVARVSWRSLAASDRPTLRVTFDGEPVEATDPNHIELPEHDPEQVHFVRAEVDLPGVAEAVDEVTFGGIFGEEVRTELTALPVRLEGRREAPSLETVQGWFLDGAQPLEVAAVEKGAAEIIVVRDASSLVPLTRAALGGTTQGFISLGPPRGGAKAERAAVMGWSLQFIWPVAERKGREDASFDLFPHSALFTKKDAGLPFLVVGFRSRDAVNPQRLADAVAVAGVTAATGNRRRVVLLVLGHDAVDFSRHQIASVRGYLDSIHVPLVVWSPTPDLADSTWGPVVDVSSWSSLLKASRALERQLDRQRIVWLDGIHLPSRISLRSEVEGLALAARQ